MKKFSMLFTLLILSLFAKSQINLEHSYQSTIGSYGGVTILTNSGKKIYMLENNNTSLKIYDLNHSLWKIIPIPQLTNNDVIGVAYVSDNLFSTDALIEFVVTYYNSNFTHYSYHVINENGTTLLTLPNSAGIDLHEYNTGVFKLHSETGNYDSVKVYSLPGTIPCAPCGGTLGESKPLGQKSSSGKLSNPIPNPSGNSVSIEYQLPYGTNEGIVELYDASGRSIKKYSVDRAFSNIVLDNSELSTGTYYYQLKAKGVTTSVRKMLIVK